MTTFEAFLSVLLAVVGIIVVYRYPKLKTLMLVFLGYLFVKDGIKKFLDKD